jgi:PST family polysaccharide transporter
MNEEPDSGKYLSRIRRLSRHRIARNAIALYGSQAANNILPWITFPYLTRVLGPEKWGLIGWSQEFIRYFIVISSFGFDLTATRQVAIHRDDPEKLSRIFSAVMIARALLAAGCFVAMLLIVEATPAMRPHLVLFMIAYLNVLGNVLFPQWLFQGLEKMGVVTAREIGTRLVGLLPTFLLVHGPQDYLWAATVQSGSGAVAALAGLLMMGKYTTARFRLVSWSEILDQYKEGWHVFLSMAAMNLYGSSNRFILRFLSGDRGVGLLLVAQRLIDAANSVAIVLSISMFPYISNLAATRRKDAMALFRRAERLIAIPFSLLSLGIFALAPLGIRILVGRQYAGTVPLLQLMSPMPLLLAFGNLYATQFMLGLGYKKEWSRIVIEGAGVNFLVLLVLLPFFDPGKCVAVTATVVEGWILLRSWLFYRKHRDDAA